MVVCIADHWQGDKLYPYAQGPFPAYSQTLGDGILHQTSQSTHYWWCWMAIGELVAYILIMNVAIPAFLTILPRRFLYLLTAACLVPAYSCRTSSPSLD